MFVYLLNQTHDQNLRMWTPPWACQLRTPPSQGLAKFGLCLWRQIILLWIFLKSSATIPCKGTRHHHITIFWALVIISSTQYFDRDIKLSEEFVHFLNSIPTRNHFTYAVRFRKLQNFSLATILDLGYKDPYFRFLEFSPIIHRLPLMKHLRGVGWPLRECGD